MGAYSEYLLNSPKTTGSIFHSIQPHMSVPPTILYYFRLMQTHIVSKVFINCSSHDPYHVENSICKVSIGSNDKSLYWRMLASVRDRFFDSVFSKKLFLSFCCADPPVRQPNKMTVFCRRQFFFFKCKNKSDLFLYTKKRFFSQRLATSCHSDNYRICSYLSINCSTVWGLCHAWRRTYIVILIQIVLLSI